MFPNPLAGRPGEPETKLEEIPTLGFYLNYTAEGVYLSPLKSGFRSPVVGEFTAPVRNLLIEFVGPDLNDQLIAIGSERPNVPPVAAGFIIPVRIRTSGVRFTVTQPIDHRDDARARLNESGTPEDEIDTIVDAVRLTSSCPVMPRWVRLPVGQFFPEWLSTVFCSGNNCSLPSGMTCDPVLDAGSILHITVLRWDCCWSFVENQWMWECGWRKVRIPIIGQCNCMCGVSFEGDGFRYTGRPGEPFYLTEGNLNS
jgi:hypothetical protein